MTRSSKGNDENKVRLIYFPPRLLCSMMRLEPALNAQNKKKHACYLHKDGISRAA